MRSTMMTTPLTLDRLLERLGGLFKDVPIVSRLPDRTLRRTDNALLYRNSRRLAQALLRAGLKPGERVATLMWNHAAHLEAYFGVPVAGGVLHTLNLRLFPQDIAYIAQHAGDRFLIVDDVLLPLFEKFRDQVKFERVFVNRFGGGVAHAYEDYAQFLDSADGDFEYPLLDENAPCGMCYTSGTTGRPKGVVYSHRSNILHALAAALPDAAALSVRDVLLPVVPMFHANAWGLPYMSAMVGCVQVFPGPHLDFESVLDLINQAGVTIAGAVPTIWMGVLQALRKDPSRRPVKPLRLMVGGSAPPPALIQGLREFGIDLIPVWGLTETSPIASYSQMRPQLDALPEEERMKYRAKAGVPLPLVDLRIWNEHGAAPWDGQSVGEIEVRGPWVTASYHDRPDAADRFSADGWFRTGDVASMTPEGYITISDRAKDLIKSGGEWISSVDLENEIMAHPAVLEAVVIAVAHDKWMERPLAVVVLRPGAALSFEQLRAHLKGKFADWWLPDGCEFVEQIPRTSTGKFQKLVLRERFAGWKPPTKGST
ncbi:MAG TPA: long-chain fatty acid--CoA ligase [Solimonas sp.]|nr:long-chain fatty acid--CoA ligase [Solimonas sp.]